MQQPVIGFIGIGMMGWPMARRVHHAGYNLVVYDASAERAQAFTGEVGGRLAASPGELAQAADIVITMLPNSRIVSSVVYEGDRPLLGSMRKDSILVDMTSGVPDVTLGIADRLQQDGITTIDAPVSGGVPRAEKGELTIMTGGDIAAVERCRGVLETMGKAVHVGALGGGQAMKALNNLVSAGGFLIGIEALLIGKKFGLRPETMVDILNTSSGMNNSTKNKFNQYVLSGKFDAGFAIELMAKDLGIAMQIAKATETPAPFSAQCTELWAAAAAMLGGKEDHTAVARMCETFAKTKLAEE